MPSTLSNSQLQTTIENFMVDLFANYHKSYIWGQANFFVYGYSYNKVLAKFNEIKKGEESAWINPTIGNSLVDVIGGESFFNRAKGLADSNQVARIYSWYYYKKFLKSQLGSNRFWVGNKNIALHLYTFNRVRILNSEGYTKDQIKDFCGIHTDSSYYFNLNAIVTTS